MHTETRYARSGDVHIAYQVAGEGELDVVFVPGFVSHLELNWEPFAMGLQWQRLASFSRLILFDKRGTGLSDRTAGIPPLEERMDDVRAVMDAVGSKRAALVGLSEGGPMSVLFAATYPERTRALVLWESTSRLYWAPDYPIGMPSDELHGVIELIEREWGTGTCLPLFVPRGRVDVAETARFERNLASPGAVASLVRANAEIDVRPVLPAIRVPTLVLHRSGDPVIPAAHGRYTAERIPGARFVELPGDYHWGAALGDGDALDEIEEFLTGVRHGPEPDRLLATLLFADIVDSTKRAVEVGDRTWRQVLDRYDAVTKREAARFRGRVVKTWGDGFLAAFDGPARAIRCACAVRDGARPLQVEVRSGLHTGEVEVRGEDLGGIAVHIGARVAAEAGAGEILVSSTVKDLVAGSGIAFEDRGPRSLKGVEDDWRLFAVL